MCTVRRACFFQISSSALGTCSTISAKRSTTCGYADARPCATVMSNVNAAPALGEDKRDICPGPELVSILMGFN